MAFHETLLDLATSQSWAALGIQLLLSTIIGGLVVIVLLAVASKAWKENTKPQNAFLMVFAINLITIFGFLALLGPIFPLAGVLLPILIWIGLTKAFFSDLRWLHAAIIGAVGYLLSIVLVPSVMGMFAGFV
ncbi:MAG: hypothetical protein HY520_05140 [Candidatus Aenigmarchaeota archaeon]|nr:hypothetical protein [Candidatus Aenigmarchaeota archaeon]